jgi:hypothetical protein
MDDPSGVRPRRMGLVTTRADDLAGRNTLVPRRADADHGGIPDDGASRRSLVPLAPLDVTRVGVTSHPHEQSPTTRRP